MVSVEDDLSGYRLVIAPLLYMCKGGFDEKIREYVKNGGAFLTTYFSGYVDEHDLVVPGGYPGKLRDICEELNIKPVIYAPEGIEATVRKNEKGEFLFLLNHTMDTLSVRMEKDGIDILTDDRYRAGDLLTIKEAGVAIVQMGKEWELWDSVY